MTTLVTGSAGFIGSHIVAALLERGVEPVGLTRQATDPNDRSGIETVNADYHDRAALRRVLRRVRPATLVHTAWRLAPQSAYLHDRGNLGDLCASLGLFTAAAEEGCHRIVGIGTCLEYAVSSEPMSEDAPLRPWTVYGASKAALFVAASAWARIEGVSFAWARLYYPFGPREADYRLIPAVTTALLRGERVATTDGHQRRSFLYVAEVADAIAAIVSSDVKGPVNVGSADAISVRDLLERLARLLDGVDLLDIGALPGRPGDPAVLAPDVGRLTETVGWRPRIGLDEGLSRTVEWWRARLEAH